MANIFDQFDAKPAAPTPASPSATPGAKPVVPLKKANPFDQFDAPKEVSVAPKKEGAEQLPIGTLTGIPNLLASVSEAGERGRRMGLSGGLDVIGGMVVPAAEALVKTVTGREGPQTLASPELFQPKSGETLKKGLSFMRLNPNDYFAEPKTPEGRIWRMAGEGLVTGALPSGAGQASGLGKLAVIAKELFAATAGGAGAQAAMELSPDELDPLTGLLGGLAGGIGGGLAAELPGAAVRGAKKGIHALAPVVAPVSKKVREGLAAESVASKVTDRDAAIENLEQPGEIVPGSMPTAAQAADDTGLRIYERALSRSDKDFREKLLDRVEENNAARVAALDNIQRDGDVGAASQFFRDRMAQLEQRADELYEAAATDARKATDDLGGERSAGEIGEQARSAMSAEFKRLNGEANTLWNAIDPDKTLHVESRPLVERAAALYGRMAPEEQLSLTPEEKALASIIGNYEGPIPFDRFKQLRTQLNEEMGNAKMSGKNRAYGRLSQLRAAIEDAIQSSIDGKFAADASLADDFVRQAKEWYARSTDTGEAGAGAGARAADAPPAGSGAVPGLVRAGRDPGVEPAAAARSEGLPEDADRGAQSAVEGGRRFEQGEVIKLDDVREKKALEGFHRGLMSEIGDRVAESRAATKAARDAGVFEGFNTGDRLRSQNHEGKPLAPMKIEETYLSPWKGSKQQMAPFDRMGVKPTLVEFNGQQYIPKVRVAQGEAPPANLTGKALDDWQEARPDQDWSRFDTYLDLVRDRKMGGLRALDQSAHEAATSPRNDLPEPTAAQKEAGNYKKAHVKFGGLDISIENPAGSKRSGADRSGKPWSVDMKDHYGYIRGTVGKDKDHIDTFIKAGARDLDADSPVFVVDQIDPRTGRFDEHKVMLGYADRAAAEAAYKANYAKDWKGMGDVTPTTLGRFKSWLKEGDTKKPFKGTANEAPENLTSRAGNAGVRPVSREPAQAARDGRREADGSLVGLPRKVGNHTASAYPDAQRVAENYMKKAGLEYRPPNTYARVQPERAKRVADAYEAMPHNPRDPKVRRAYKAMADETLAQYRAMLDDGMKIEFIGRDQPDPYAGNPRNMTEDVRNNKHMWVFATRDGFGSDATFDVSENPLLADSGFTISGQPAVINDIFRAVHDYFGHVKEGVGFRADGEENAWRAHSAMYSPEARKAMTTETRGQNSWVNYGPYGEKNRTAKSEDTHYADQKIGILPDWAISEGAGDPPVKIADTLAQRIEQAGRPVSEAKATGAVVNAFYDTMAKRLGTSVDDLLEKHPLPQVRRGDGARDGLQQADKEPRNLYVVHNIKPGGVLNAAKIGGLPMPSLAVARIDKGAFDNYGSISLIGSPEMIDPKGGRGAKTFDADVYSPRYPSVQHEVDSKAFSALNKRVTEHAKDVGGDEHRGALDLNRIEDRGIDDAIDSQGLKRLYLAEKGKVPEIVMRDDGKGPDFYGNEEAINKAIRPQRAAYEDWARSQLEPLVKRERIFKGFDYNGNRRYREHNLENVLADMRGRLKEGESWNYGVGTIRSKHAKQFKSISGIQKARDRITGDMKTDKDAFSDRLMTLLDEMRPFYKFDGKSFQYMDDASQMLAEMGSKGWRALDEGFESLPLDVREKIGSFLDDLKSAPTEYFETKMNRAVGLGEFQAALVPAGVVPRVRKALEDAGLLVIEYDPKVEGSRAAAVRQLEDQRAEGSQRVLFQPAPPVDTRAFKRWFGDSKVVDAEGKPLVVYHGTNAEPFDAFDLNGHPARLDAANGFFFTADPQYSYVRAAGFEGENRHVYPVYLRIENPLYVERSEFMEGLNAWENAKAYIDDLKAKGHDGIIWGDPENLRKPPRGAWGDDRSQIFVFDPTQIKSVNNRGTFDPNDPRILYQSEPEASASPFYSAALRAVETSKTGKASPQQWLATLKNTQGVKGEELEWIGLEPWLASQSGPVTREQVADFIRANQIEVEDVDLRGTAAEAEADLPRRFDWEPDDIDEDYVRERAGERVVEEEQDYRDRVARYEDIEPEEVTQEQMEALAFEDEMHYREEEPDSYHASVSLEAPDGETVIYDLYRDSSGYTTILRDGSDVSEGRSLDDGDIRDAISADFRENFSKEAEGDGPTQYEEYTLPGGEDYHELLLRLPERTGREGTRPSAEVQEKYKDEWDALVASQQPLYDIRRTGTMTDAEKAQLNGIRDEMDALHAKMVEETRATQAPWKQGENFDAPHFDDAPPNILAHVRFKTRTSADGKKTLFLEEVQSDWHQQGRDRGYKFKVTGDDKARLLELEAASKAANREADRARISAAKEASGGEFESQSAMTDALYYAQQAAVRKHGIDSYFLWNDPTPDQIARGDSPSSEKLAALRADPEVVRGTLARDALSKYAANPAVKAVEDARTAASEAHQAEFTRQNGGVPDAPFKTSWPELAMKRMIRWAAQNGYDQIAWTPGEVQNARYGLATHVDSIEWKPIRGGEGNDRQIAIHPKAGRYMRLQVDPNGKVTEAPQPDWTGKPLSEVLGKDVADKIMSEAEGEMGANDLVLGGSGMRQFYDKMLPSVANKLGKKFGAQTAKSKIEMPQANRWSGAPKDVLEADSIPITKEMRDAAMQGQPLFQSTPKDPRGSIQFGNPETIISLFKGADASTAIHEAAHHFLHMYRSFADAADTPKAIADDWRAAKTWWDKNANDVAKDGGDGITAADVRKVLREGTTGDMKKDVAVDRGLHEQWARGFETYLRDGTAPNNSLKAIFKQFKDWLTSIYRDATDLGVKLTPEIREVFDRMLGGTGKKMMDDAAAGRFKAASAATKNIKETFGAKPVKAMMRRQGATYPFEMPSESVTSNLWKAGPQGATNIKNVMKAAGASADAKDAIEAAAVLSLKRAAGRDGMIDPKKLADWKAKHADALREVPDLAKRMNSAGAAGEAVAEIAAKRKEALDAVRRTAIGKLLKVEDDADVARAIGTMLNSSGAVKAMKELVGEARRDPEAMAGLQRAVVDHLLSRFKTPKDALSADAFQKYIGRNTPALSQVLDPEQISAVHAIAKDLKRATKDVRSPGGGSDTAENLGDRARFGIEQPSIWRALLRRAAAGLPGALIGFLHSHIASAMAFMGGAVIQHLREAGIKTVDDLIREAMLDPALMRALLQKAPKKPDTGSAISFARILADSTRRAMVLSTGIDDEDRWLNRRASSPPPHKEARSGITPALGVRG